MNETESNEGKRLGDSIYGLFPDEQADSMGEIRELREP